MPLLTPWDHIQMTALKKFEEVQFFDSRIHILFVLSGEASLMTSQLSLSLSKDDFYLLTKTEPYQISIKKGTAFLLTLDYFAESKDLDQTYIFRGNSVANPRATDLELVSQLKQLMRLCLTDQQHQSQTQIFQQYFTFMHLLEQYYQVTVQTNQAQNIRGQIEDIKFYIDQHFEQEIRLSDLADQLFISEQYLSRIFKEQNGIGVSEYLVRKRLEKVRQLLLTTEESITDIAFSSGFSNINSFNRIFKKYQGLTPSEYRQELKQSVKVETQLHHIEAEDLEEIKHYLGQEASQEALKTIAVDITKSIPFKQSQLMINLGYAGDLLHRSLIKETKFVKEYTSFQYGRVWGILNQNILKEVSSSYDYNLVDEIIQNILDLGLIPFLDFGFKGKQIHDTFANILAQESFDLPSNDLSKLLQRITSFMQHMVDRFGYDEVSRWKVEIWKPNSLVLKNIKQGYLAEIQDGNNAVALTENNGYFTYFSRVKQAIQEIVPEVAVGGSGLSLDLEEEVYLNFIEEWSKEATCPDFLSLSGFPIDTMKQNDLNAEAWISSNADFLKNQLQRVRNILDNSNLCTQLILSEFNITISARDLVNDSAFKGPYILKNVIAIYPYCDVIGYWQLSDLSFVTFDVTQKEIFGGAGLISKNGIPKPSFFAFDFLDALGDKILYQSENVIMTQKGNQLVLLFHHYSHLNSQYYYANQETFTKTNISEMFENDGQRQFHLILDNVLPNHEYKLRIRHLGVTHGSFLTEANALSLIENYNREEIHYLKSRCLPKLQRDIVTSKERKLEFDVELSQHDMLLIQISK